MHYTNMNKQIYLTNQISSTEYFTQVPSQNLKKTDFVSKCDVP